MVCRIQENWIEKQMILTMPFVSGNRSANPMEAIDGHALPNLEYKPRQHDVVFIEAAHILESMKLSPSCNKVAATQLITSCQLLGGKYTGDPLKDEYETLDRIRSMYAARLALCELHGAGAAVPSPCIPVTVNAPSTSSFRIPFITKAQPLDTRNDLVPDEVLGPCLKTLESRPQSWTSYSNNRQNAMIICQATRIEVEREELLDIHQRIVKTSSKLHQGLEEALHSAAMETTQHEAFLKTLRAMQDKVSAELQASASVTQNTLEGLLQAIELSLTKITASATSTINSLVGNANSVGEVRMDHFYRIRAKLNDTRIFNMPQNPFGNYRMLCVECRKTRRREVSSWFICMKKTLLLIGKWHRHYIIPLNQSWTRTWQGYTKE